MITVEEKYLGRQLKRQAFQGSASVAYIVQGTDDDIAAAQAAEDTAPDTWDGLPLMSVDTFQIASTIWECTVNYGIQNNNAAILESNYSFETGGGTQHVTQSLATISRYAPAGKTAGDFKGAIGVDNNSVNGVDIVVPVYSWTDVYWLSNSVVDTPYKQTLFNLTGKVNNASWNGYNAGEVLFIGDSGSKRGNSGDWEMAFKFAASPNVTGKTVGDITGITKKGWDYLWIRYEDSDDATAKSLIKKPASVHVEQVYEYGNFALLGI